MTLQDDENYDYETDQAVNMGTSVIGRVSKTTNPDARLVGSVLKRVDPSEQEVLSTLGPDVAPAILYSAESHGGAIADGEAFVLMPFVGPDLTSICRDIAGGTGRILTADEIDQLVEDLLQALETAEAAGVECTQLRSEHVLLAQNDTVSCIRLCGFGGATPAGDAPGREHLRLWAEMMQNVLPTLAGGDPPGNNPEALRRTIWACGQQNPLDRPGGAAAALDMVKMPLEPIESVAPAIPPRPASPPAPTVFELVGDWLNRHEAKPGRRLDPHRMIVFGCGALGLIAGMTIMSGFLGR